MKIIAKLTSEILNRQHYRQEPLDKKLSAQIFDTYLETLDPTKIYFTQDDIAKFEPQRNTLSEQLLLGKTDFAFEVYDLFKKRFDEFHQYTINELKNPIDFTLDENYTPDRRKLPYAKDETELKELWRLRIKNDLLNLKLLQRSIDEELNKKSDDDTAKEKIQKHWEIKDPAQKLLNRMHDLQNHYDQRDNIDILSMYLNAVTSVYGPHSSYLAPKNDEDFDIQMSLSLTGIGATLTSDNGYIRVVEIVPGSPAAIQGQLQPGDRIIAVTQEGGEPVDVVDMALDNAVKLIRGPAKSKVTLSILAAKQGKNVVPENITIVRDKIILKASEAQGEIKMIKSEEKEYKIGIIKLPSFYMDFKAYFSGDENYKSCSRDVENILKDFKQKDVDAVVMDIRNNGGGSLPESIRLTGLFIKTGPVVQIRSAFNNIDVEKDNDEKLIWDGPLVVLINKMSASASEIFAGAIKDNRRGLIVGDSRSFGKGTVLNMIELEQLLGFINTKFPAGTVCLETSMFFRVNGSSVQQLGISPDIVLPSITEHLEIGELFHDNHLPWDSIASQPASIFNEDLTKNLDTLKANSQKRIAEDTNYQKLIKRINQVEKQLKKKSVSLNEEQRWNDYIGEKELIDAEEKALQSNESESTKDKKVDPILKEASHIAIDLIKS